MTTTPEKEALKLERQRVDLDLKKLELVRKNAEAEAAKLNLERTGYSVAEYRRQEEARKASESQHRVFSFDDEVNDGNVETLSDWLKNRSARFPGADLTVYVNSPGGSVFAGFVAMDAIREAETAGNKVTVKVTGMAASMAGVIAQAASTRLIGKDSELMIHTAGTFMIGGFKTFAIEDQSEFLKRLTRKCVKAYALRSEKWDEQALFDKVHKGRKDWWLSADEAVEEGFMDGTF